MRIVTEKCYNKYAFGAVVQISATALFFHGKIVEVLVKFIVTGEIQENPDGYNGRSKSGGLIIPLFASL